MYILRYKLAPALAAVKCDVIGRNEYLIFTMLVSTVIPQV